MKIIAVEEAFSKEGMKMVPKLSDATAPMSVDAVIMTDWEKRLADFTQRRLPEMDVNGVGVHVLSLTAPGIQAVTDAVVAVTDAKAANDYLAAVIAKHPDRFKGFAALPLQDPAAAARELRRCVRELKLSGALVNDHTSGHYLDEPQFLPVWQALEEMDVPLYIHPGAPPVDTWNLLNGYPYTILVKLRQFRLQFPAASTNACGASRGPVDPVEFEEKITKHVALLDHYYAAYREVRALLEQRE